ncbi:YkgJ family cysteine cluster protein [Reinekea thalattae]|uniref:YkgJ family cysteine cluster protein n=1 Tax=Reinekea thalattae TaxID=2593301 RepID=A0A5C8Z627_9GAMM|nr:YkgJ family cysteine cluster protein [Reinekea thalattae]TXR53067.1 YkgJ family cysteine cluster protein [Reinekea thalattae]
MECREQCGACCIAPSINKPFYGMPHGKPAGVACIHLDRQMRCQLFADPRRPKVCAQFVPEVDFCGESKEQALVIMLTMEGIEAESFK